MLRRQILIGSTTTLVGLSGCLGDGQSDENDKSEWFRPRESGGVKVANQSNEAHHLRVTVTPSERETGEAPLIFEASATFAPDEKFRAENVISRPGMYQIEAETNTNTITYDWDVEEPDRNGVGEARITIDDVEGLQISILELQGE